MLDGRQSQLLYHSIYLYSGFYAFLLSVDFFYSNLIGIIIYIPCMFYFITAHFSGDMQARMIQDTVFALLVALFAAHSYQRMILNEFASNKINAQKFDGMQQIMD